MYQADWQSWASSQIRSCGLTVTKKVADLQTLAVKIEDLQLRTVFDFDLILV